MSMTKTIRATALAAVAMTVLATAASAETLRIDPGKVQIKPRHQIEVLPERLLPRLACPDPAAVELRVANVRTRRGTSGTVYEFDVVGTVRNVGAGTWSSGRGQQIASLARNGTTVSSRDFVSLSPGASFSLSHRMSIHAAEEFPPEMSLRISYDPDIRIDGNTANDDCRTGNNQRRLTGQELLRLAATS